ncbi:type VII secretion protein EccCa [Candidatus Mycolicibacterium alkanivorans]|uniref:Type VII secretion protein EccCa n=1 Tax=Candidatus Mycolicibacterium alkanivorans TaxID=2954114 RepID=A0ABS9Z358_9MYCO|nr:type VII secretion protein EccCa [Candidatus Mycolicibacterium alkanivorans]MCI4676944.1 type VII secretion protein EccCa [Candidatus Mycolicibacterium alkanivorans]
MVTTSVDFARGERLPPPPFPTDDVAVDAPPVPPQGGGGSSRLVPLVALVAIAGTGALLWFSRSGSGLSPMMLTLPAVTMISTFGMLLQGRSRRDTGRLDEQRRRYLDHLDSLSRDLLDAAERQRLSMTWVHPAPTALWTLAGGPRMWERSVADSDFGHVRVGLATQRLCRAITVPPVAPVADLDPVTADALRRFVHSHATLDDVPTALALCALPAVSVTGPLLEVRALVRSMLCQLAVLHDPGSILIAAVVGPGRREDWDWLKWLPHNRHPSRGAPMVYDDGSALGDVTAEVSRRHVVLVIDGAPPEPPAGPAPVTTVVVGEAFGDSGLRLHLEDGQLVCEGERFARADSMSLPEARVCARRLARYRASQPASDDIARWCAQAGLDDAWTRRSPRDRLRVPLGFAADGATVDLDIKEAADGGHGPHGLCVGATGSGKSELLRTIVLGMVARHSPEDLNLVLIDFKGGATFLGLAGLHHIAAIITNLSDEAQLVARAGAALAGEIHRRQQLLRRAGNVVNLGAYRLLRGGDHNLPALPSLFVVVDEFAELLHHHPDFAEVFAMIGRVGRSLGVHLLLASQRLDEGRLRGLESHLSYRICLKTSTAAESRAVLGVPDAAELPTTPGAAYLCGADGRLLRFRAAYLGAPAPAAAADRPEERPAVRLFTSLPATIAVPRGGHQSVADTLVDRFTGRGPRAHQVWLPPLPRSPRLSELPDTDHGELRARIGLVDRPFDQKRVPLVVETGGAGGNVAVVGSPQSGKSQTVRTLITALAFGHDARRIQFYCLDFGGGTLDDVRALPHVGSVATRAERELVRRIVGHVDAVMRSREAGVTDGYGDVFLVVDGWAVLREEFADLDPTITGLASQGLSFGIHVILTAGRWADLRPSLKDQIGTRIELRLGDPIDSEMDRKQAALVPVGAPGRGVTRDGHHFTIATSSASDVACRGSWRAPAVRLLPDMVDHASVRDQADGDPGVVLGIGEPDLMPLAVDFGRQPHLLVVGDPGCGKTATLRTLCREIVRRTTPQSGQLFVVDYRRTLLGIVDPGHLHGYAFSPAAVTEHLSALHDALRNRLPTPDVTVEQFRARSWWSGPEVYIVVDDYDLLASGSGDALAALLDVLPHATDIGLHLIVARRCAGLARAMYDPVLAHLRDIGCMTLVMSGSAEEGAVIGTHRATPQPPGRGLLVTRDAARRIQVGWCPP